MLLASPDEAAHTSKYVPHVFWVWPFVAILMAIAILPLMRKTHHWWEENHNKLLIAVILSIITLCYYGFRGEGVVSHEKGAEHATPAATEPGEHHGGEMHAVPDKIIVGDAHAEEQAHQEHRTSPGGAPSWLS